MTQNAAVAYDGHVADACPVSFLGRIQKPEARPAAKQCAGGLCRTHLQAHCDAAISHQLGAGDAVKPVGVVKAHSYKRARQDAGAQNW